jgi:protein Mpv17
MQLQTRPVITKSLTNGVLVGFGDAFAQAIEKRYVIDRKNSEYDWGRTLRNSTYGVLVLGPLLHSWFQVLSRIAPHIPPRLDPYKVKTHKSYKLVQGAKQMLVDQIVYAPFGLSLFFTYRSLIDGQTMEQTIENIKFKLWPALQTCWKFWPIIHLSMLHFTINTQVNFAFVPLHFRTVFGNIFAILWNTYLSYLHNTVQKEPAVALVTP